MFEIRYNHFMNKFLLALFAILVMLGLVNCEENQDDSSHDYYMGMSRPGGYGFGRSIYGPHRRIIRRTSWSRRYHHDFAYPIDRPKRLGIYVS